jgi:hypothetical protein
VFIYDRLSEQFSGPQAAFGTTFKVTGCYWKAVTSPLERVEFSSQKTATIVKIISAPSECSVLIFRTFKNIFIS